MPASRDLLQLDDHLNELAKLYQFRSVDDRTYGPLTVSHSYCLRILFFRGQRTMGELAAELEVRLSTMTGIVDQLEQKGLVERVDHPDDRRSFRVGLTRKGQVLYRGAHDAFLSHLEPLLNGRSAAARHEILNFLAGAIRVVQGWRDNPTKVQRHGKTNPQRKRLGR